MKTKISGTLLIALLFTGFILSSCSKENSIDELKNNPQQIALEQTKDHNDEPPTAITILNRDLVVIYAIDGGTDITQQFKDLTFHFQGQYPSGTAYAWNDIMSQTGSWSGSNADFTINYPTDKFHQLAFFNKTWTLMASSSAVVRLVTEDGDEVQFAAK